MRQLIQLTPQQLEIAQALIRNGVSIKQAAPTVGTTEYVLRCALNPEWRIRIKEGVKRRRARDIPEPRESKSQSFRERYGHTIHMALGRYTPQERAPEHVLAERDNRPEPRTLGQLLLGEPVDGRSALDQRNAANCDS